MKKLLLTILLVVGINYSQGVDYSMIYLIENYAFSSINVATLTNDTTTVNQINITDDTDTYYLRVASDTLGFYNDNDVRIVYADSLGDLWALKDITAGEDLVAVGDVSVGDDILMATGGIIGITGNEIITFDEAGTINFTGASVDVDGAFSASSLESDAGAQFAGGLTGVTTMRTTGNIGTADSASVVALEYGDGFHHITVLTLSAHIVGTPNAGNNLAFGSTLYTFPAGTHVHYTTYSNIGFTAGTQQDDAPDIGVGSVVGSGASATLNGGDNEDYITGQTWASTLDGTAEIDGPLGATAGILTGISLNAAANSKKVILNAADGWHASITGNLTADGTVIIVWDFLE